MGRRCEARLLEPDPTYLEVAVRLAVTVVGRPLAAETETVPLKAPAVFGAVNRTTTLHEPLTARVAQVVERTVNPAPVTVKLARVSVAAALPEFLTEMA